MHALRALLSISPVLQCSGFRHAPLFLAQDLRLQCPSSNLQTAPSKRSFSHNRMSPNASFSYRIAASFSGKGRRFNPKNDTYSYSSDLEVLEGPFTGRPGSGQDAFFVSRIGNSSKTAFGVADGVGGWSDSGFDSAHFSHGLCQSMARIAESTMDDSQAETLRPTELLAKAYKGILADRIIEGGGSTACIGIGRGDGNITIANLGDSGFAQLRLGKVEYYSNPQTHAFNTPYQLSIVPPRVLAMSRAFGGGPLHDMPKDASITTHSVRHGDILVFATDGVWDNLSLQDLLKVVSRQMHAFHAWEDGEKGVEVNEWIYKIVDEGGIPLNRGEQDLQSLVAANIVGEAKRASQDIRRDGPFAREIQKHYPDEGWHGGKVDDICVVVAIVVDEEQGG